MQARMQEIEVDPLQPHGLEAVFERSGETGLHL
jgi:hypothetical protein